MSDVSRAFQWNPANQVRRTEQYRENARRETKAKGIRTRKNAVHKCVSIEHQVQLECAILSFEGRLIR